MIEKVKAVLGSLRFWEVTAIALVQVLALYELVPAELANIVSGWLGVSITIETVDKAGKSIGKK